MLSEPESGCVTRIRFGMGAALIAFLLLLEVLLVRCLFITGGAVMVLVESVGANSSLL